MVGPLQKKEQKHFSNNQRRVGGYKKQPTRLSLNQEE
jgi:hypothetical protein